MGGPSAAGIEQRSGGMPNRYLYAIVCQTQICGCFNIMRVYFLGRGVSVCVPSAAF